MAKERRAGEERLGRIDVDITDFKKIAICRLLSDGRFSPEKFQLSDEEVGAVLKKQYLEIVKVYQSGFVFIVCRLTYDDPSNNLPHTPVEARVTLTRFITFYRDHGVWKLMYTFPRVLNPDDNFLANPQFIDKKLALEQLSELL